MRLWKTALVAVSVLISSGAAAICPETSVKGLDGICLDASCPPGVTAYMATIENRFPNQLYITYSFRRPDKALITAGLTLKPGISRMPLGFGPAQLPPSEEYDKRVGRLRILECGANPDIIYRWRKK